MGCCGSSLTAEELAELNESRRFDSVLKEVKKEDVRIIKLLLLGTGESGKTTIFKQMQILYEQDGFSDFEKKTFKHVLRRNIIECIQTLIMGCQKFELPFKNEESEEIAKQVMNFDPLQPEFWADENCYLYQTPLDERAGYSGSVQGPKQTPAL